MRLEGKLNVGFVFHMLFVFKAKNIGLQLFQQTDLKAVQAVTWTKFNFSVDKMTSKEECFKTAPLNLGTKTDFDWHLGRHLWKHRFFQSKQKESFLL